jgi:transposase InsO family protein
VPRAGDPEKPMSSAEDVRGHRRWAEVRFSIVGRLLSCPPLPGELRREIEKLAATVWKHPLTQEPVRFGASTIERWYYQAKKHDPDPVSALARKVRSDCGRMRSLSKELIATVLQQYDQHKGWTVKLHYDNLAVRVEQDPKLGPLPSYSTLLRHLRLSGLSRVKVGRGRTEGEIRAAKRKHEFEVRSFEASYVNQLWHLDFHDGSRPVLLKDGRLVTPKLLVILDDHSRLICHAQWYLHEDAECAVHGLVQAFLKRDLPRDVFSDNGPGFIAEEFEEGCTTLSIGHDTTLSHSPYQNGKAESFWNQAEGRLMAMLEGEKALTLELLNEATQAWVELEYHRTEHSEIGCAPLRRFLEGQSVGRACPDLETLRRAFKAKVRRKQRKSDGTIVLDSIRYEIPSRYRTLSVIWVRTARWDRSSLEMFDPRTEQPLCVLYPLDKVKNADGHRRRVDPVAGPLHHEPFVPPPSGIAPLLKKLMEQYRATGLPPAYLPHDQGTTDPNTEEPS